MVRYILDRKILAFIIACFVCCAAFAEDQAGITYTIDDFSKGLNTKLNEYIVQTKPKAQGTVVQNLRFNEELGSLTKRAEHLLFGTADTTEVITGMHRLYLNDTTKKLLVTHSNQLEAGADATGVFTSLLTLTSSGYRFDGVTWHNLAILTDGYNQPIKTNGTKATYLGACFGEDAESGAGPDGTYTYKVAFYTASYEVSLGAASSAVVVVDNDIDLSMIPIGPDTYLGETVVGRNIYRTTDAGSTYKLLTNGVVSNNTAVTLTDSDADGALGATLSPTTTMTPPTARFACVYNNRLFLACNPTSSNFSRVYYSDSGNHDYFPTTYHQDIRLNDGDNITFITNFLGRLTIGKDRTIQYYYVDGSDPATDWEVSDPFSNKLGCRSPYTVENVPGVGLVFLSDDGLYRFTGNGSFPMSEAITPEIRDITASSLSRCWSAYSNNLYYLLYTSERSGSANNNRMLVFDVQADAYSIDLVDYNTLCVFDSGDDNEVVYAGSSTNGAVYSFGDSDVGMIHVKHADFTGTWDDMRYIPTGTPGGDENHTEIELAWDCTVDGWLTELQAKNANIDTIDKIETYITTALVDRPDGGGTYISQVLDLNIDSYDKIYWNERIPASGGDVTLALRSAATSAGCLTASWSGEYSDPTGSDISALTANQYLQYRITLTSTDPTYTPTIYSSGGYTVKIAYNREGATSETTVPMTWTSGWLSMHYPNQLKHLQRFRTYHTGTEGDLVITFENFSGDKNTMTIDLSLYPDTYEGYFDGGMLSGELFKITIYNNDLNKFSFDRLLITHSVQETVY